MRYTVTTDFIKISETVGTIQNLSHIYNIEVSNKAELDSGILLHPLNKFTFNDETIFLRCVDGTAEVRVVPFLVDTFGGTVQGGTSGGFDTFDDSDVDDIFNP